MADNFHPTYRTRANSIYSLGIYIGGALSSLTGLMISGIGWRWAFAIVGIVGGAAGLLGLLFIREPERGYFDVKKAADTPKVEKPPPLT